MDIKEIKLLVKLMSENDLTEMDLTDGDQKISFRRASASVPVVVAAPAPAVVVAPFAGTIPVAPVEEKSDLIEITSPMVGTYYSAASPDSDPYVSLGKIVSDESVVCIVEAMKVMNEIKAECSGTIMEICVKNAQPVEFGQVLYRVKAN